MIDPRRPEPDLPEGWELGPGGSILRCRALGARHAFSTRLGGVSGGLYASLNVGLSSGDDPDRVRENRGRFVMAGGFSGPWASLHQVHGADAVRVGPSGEPTREHGDAILCDAPGRPVGVFVADCTPILVADEDGGRVGAVHAGWRGTAAGVVYRAVEAMRRIWDIVPSRLVAAIGPAARRCCYEVGDEVVATLEQADPGPPRDDRETWQAQGPRRTHVDLPVLVRRQLRAAGLDPGRIHASGLCTLCRPDLLFSYRRDGQASGRMVAVIEPEPPQT